jgi:membrane-bound lytic murein transglycosylase D
MKQSKFRSVFQLVPLLTALLLSGCTSNPTRSTSPPETARAPDSVTKASDRKRPDRTSADLQFGPEKSEPATPEVLTAQSSDLWERIRTGNRLDIPKHPRIQHELDALQANPGFFLRTAQRSEPYLHFIVEEIERRGLPVELALIPAVESGFQPLARSPHQAAGLWQFIPSTGRAFGLKQTWWYEGRCDITASTRAALDYLERLAGQFDGDWALALAAYNAGPGMVRRAIKRNRDEGLPLDYWSLELPSETQQYVPRVFAFAKAVRSPDKFGIDLPPMPDRAQFTKVDLPGPIDLDLAAKLAQIDRDELQRLNPGFRRWATAPDGPHALLLPPDTTGTFSAGLAQLTPAQCVTLHHYRVKQGDTLASIAKRYDISAKQLRKANSMKSSHLNSGRQLIIPLPPVQAAKLARNESQKSSTKDKRKTSKPEVVHVVKRGDTLWKIARTHKVSQRKLAAWNGLTVNDTLRPGQLLHVVGLGGDQNVRAVVYRIKPGDSLYTIARRYKVSVKDLRRWNKLSDRYLQPGQRLKIYLRNPVTTAL